MRLLRSNEIELSPADRVFRYSPALAVLAFLALASLGAALLLIDWKERFQFPRYIGYYIAGIIFLGLVLLRRFLLARLRPSNWLVRMGSDDLLIQFRSYLNYSMPDQDVTVVAIPYRDIKSARSVRERSRVPDQDGATQQTRHLVELELTDDLTSLSTALANEFARPAARKKSWYGYTSTLYRHYPVRLSSSSFLEIEWSVRPGTAAFLDALGAYTVISPPVKMLEDFTHIGNLSHEEQKKRLRDLDQKGQTIAAVYIARKLYGYDLAQAKTFIEAIRTSQ
jgi:hypothetical protein